MARDLLHRVEVYDNTQAMINVSVTMMVCDCNSKGKFSLFSSIHVKTIKNNNVRTCVHLCVCKRARVVFGAVQKGRDRNRNQNGRGKNSPSE